MLKVIIAPASLYMPSKVKRVKDIFHFIDWLDWGTLDQATCFVYLIVELYIGTKYLDT